ncbi:MAG TPA: His/Gly/Thr/Pro-type tRNA ligase C-terminal domain-containing protein, partial [Gemmatimonadaceae bacterium]|nr:His/Gly/Thr/Pro-type tRNA ligase C-terminal domain-containing protein [Gemmatimonadaceae bacterium]
LRAREQMRAAVPGVDVWVAFGDGATVGDAMRVASRLRERGVSVEYALGGQQLSRQLRAAGAAGARDAVILGAPNAAPGEATVRRLDDGEERRVRLDDWIDEAGSPGAARPSTHS